MDIHHSKRWHGLRELAKEIGTIVLGVLIALGAEQFVEAVHWNHKLHQTTESLRLELLEDDAPQAYSRMALGKCLYDGLDAISTAVKNDRTRKEVRALVAHYSPPDYSWDAEAWRVILASDVGSHTSAQQMILWSAPYRSIPILSATGDRERLRGEDLQLNQGGENLTPSEKDRLLSTTYDLSRANEHMAHWSRAFLRALFDLHMEIPQKARRETMDIVRARFGDCAVEPNYAHYDPYNQANGWEDRAATPTQ